MKNKLKKRIGILSCSINNEVGSIASPSHRIFFLKLSVSCIHFDEETCGRFIVEI